MRLRAVLYRVVHRKSAVKHRLTFVIVALAAENGVRYLLEAITLAAARPEPILRIVALTSGSATSIERRRLGRCRVNAPAVHYSDKPASARNQSIKLGVSSIEASRQQSISYC